MNKTIKKLMCLLLAMIMFVGCCTTFSFAASGTKKMTAYRECIKKGNTVYCCGQSGIYKVNLKNGKKSVLVKMNYPNQEDIVGMKLHKGYIYYAYVGMEGETAIYRVKTNGKARKKLAGYYTDYDVNFAVSGKKIYYKGYSDYYQEKSFKRSMKLNGSKKTKSSMNVKTKYVKSNAKGYSVVTKEKYLNGCYAYVTYLKLPSGKLKYLGFVYEEE